MHRYVPLPRYIPSEAIERFWNKIDKSAGPEGCWLWTGSVDGHGYGKLKLGGINYRSHRMAYKLITGIDPLEQLVCHRCDVPKCCNPAHHFLGDNSANQKDAVAKGRQKVGERNGAGENSPAAKLSAADVDKVREMIRGGSTNMAISRVFGVTHQAISRIRRGRAWGTEPMQPKYASLKR